MIPDAMILSTNWQKLGFQNSQEIGIEHRDELLCFCSVAMILI